MWFALKKRNPAEFGQRPGDGRPGYAGADNGKIEIGATGHRVDQGRASSFHFRQVLFRSGEAQEQINGFLPSRPGYEYVVMVVPGQDIGADACFC